MTFDLYQLRDERTVLNNPHRGWYWHYIDCGYSRPRYRDDRALIGDVTAFPGLRQLYLRFDWCDVNPRKGVYDFSYLDRIMDEWGSRGYCFSMRMCTFQCETPRWNNNQRATPDYVREAGARGFDLPNNAWEPDYSDGIFLGFAEETLQALGEHYSHDPRLEFVDVGTFGRYGEGHTQTGHYGLETLTRHIDMHRAAFPHTLLMVNDDMLHHNMTLCPELTRYCRELGLGLRDDSICVAGPARSIAGYDTLRDPRLFDAFRHQAPVDIEFAHAELIPEDVWRSGFPALEALRRTGATYAGFHDYPGRFLKNNSDLAEYAANRLGYWLRPDTLTLTPHGGSVTMTNLGWAKCYLPLSLKLRLTADGAAHDLGVIADGAWEPGTTMQDFALDLTNLHGTFNIALALNNPDGVNIRMAVNKKYLEDGWLQAGIIQL